MSMQEHLDAAIRKVFRDDPAEGPRSGIVVDWVLTTEVAAVDGDVYLHTIRSRDCAMWKALGMLEAHAGDLRADMIQPATGGDE